MIPAPVTRSATTVPGSGIAVGGFTVVGGLYIQGYGRVGPEVSPSSSVCVGSVIIGAGDSITGTSSTGSVIGVGDGVGGDGAPPPQALEKFPGPHTYCAEAGGAAAI